MKIKKANVGQQAGIKRRESLAIEAADWVSREELTETDREQLSRWLTESPVHVKELLVASAWRDTLAPDLADCPLDVERLLSASNILPMPVETTLEERPRPHKLHLTRRKLFGLGVAAAAVVAFAAVLLVESLLRGQVYTTGVGEQLTVALPDGSLVSMNTRSRVRVEYSANVRSVQLGAGQAMFSVVPDPQRPFRVYVDRSLVQALGTKFDIRRGPEEVSVAVIEGRVQISTTDLRAGEDSAAKSAAKLAAGEAADILHTGQVTPPKPIDINQATAWQERRLVFNNDTLKDILAEFERYTRTRFRIQDANLGLLRFSGVWDADRPDKLLAYLSRFGHVKVEQRDNEFLLTAAGASR